MATTHFRCESCLRVFPFSRIAIGQNKAEVCPNCYSEDIFPFRLFACNTCGFQGDQYEFFPESAGDPDPIKEQWPYRCPIERQETHCACGGTTYTQVPIPDTTDTYHRRSDNELEALRADPDTLPYNNLL